MTWNPSDFAMGRQPFHGSELSIQNTDSVQLTPGTLVKLDTSNPMSATQPIDGMVRTAAVTDVPDAVVIENIPVGGTGRVQLAGMVNVLAAGSISIGAILGPSGATSGTATAYTAGDPSLGKAFTPATAANQFVRCRMFISKNA